MPKPETSTSAADSIDALVRGEKPTDPRQHAAPVARKSDQRAPAHDKKDARIDELCSAVDALQERIAVMDSVIKLQRKTLEAHVQTTADRWNELETRVADAERALGSVKALVDKLDGERVTPAEHAALMGRVDALETDLESTQRIGQRLAGVQAQNKARQSEVDTLKERVEEVDRDAEEDARVLRAQVEDLTRQVQVLKASAEAARPKPRRWFQSHDIARDLSL